MSLTVSVCCGAEILRGLAGAGRFALPINVCSYCTQKCEVETVGQRDDRMRVEGAVAVCMKRGPMCDGAKNGVSVEINMESGEVTRNECPGCCMCAPGTAERIVREMKERDKR